MPSTPPSQSRPAHPRTRLNPPTNPLHPANLAERRHAIIRNKPAFPLGPPLALHSPCPTSQPSLRRHQRRAPPDQAPLPKHRMRPRCRPHLHRRTRYRASSASSSNRWPGRTQSLPTRSRRPPPRSIRRKQKHRPRTLPDRRPPCLPARRRVRTSGSQHHRKPRLAIRSSPACTAPHRLTRQPRRPTASQYLTRRCQPLQRYRTPQASRSPCPTPPAKLRKQPIRRHRRNLTAIPPQPKPHSRPS